MSGATLQRKVVVTNPEGFHLRPLAAFAQTAMRFQSQVVVTRAGFTADGKSALSLLGLAAEQGTRLVVQVSGIDAPAALAALLELMTSLSLAAEEHDPDPRNQGSGIRDQEPRAPDS